MLTNKHIKHWCYRHSNISTLTHRSNRTNKHVWPPFASGKIPSPKLTVRPWKWAQKEAGLSSNHEFPGAKMFMSVSRKLCNTPCFLFVHFLFGMPKLFSSNPLTAHLTGGHQLTSRPPSCMIRSHLPKRPASKTCIQIHKKERWCAKHLAKWKCRETSDIYIYSYKL